MTQESNIPEMHSLILVVEDEFLIRMMLSDSLREVGYQVEEACNADEALVSIKAAMPDLIISDVRMPGSLDGIGLLAVMKLSYPRLPIIITSGHCQPALAMAAGANSFVAKPYLFAPMLGAVQSELANVH